MIFFMGAILNADARRAITVMPQLALFADRASDENPSRFRSDKASARPSLTGKISPYNNASSLQPRQSLPAAAGVAVYLLRFAPAQRGGYSNASIDTAGI
jgi:hypothetical protein